MSVSATIQSINYNETTDLIINDFVKIFSVTPSDSIINIINSGYQYIYTVKPQTSTLYIINGKDINGNNLTVSVTIYVNVTVINSTININYNTSTVLSAFGSINYIWYPNTFLSTTIGFTTICTPLHDITYTIQGTDKYGVITITNINVIVNTFMEFTPNNPIVYDGNKLEISVKYNNLIPENQIYYKWISSLFTGLPNNCITSKSNNNIVLHPYNSIYYNVTAYNLFNNQILSTSKINIIVIPKPSHIIDIDILPIRLNESILNRNKKKLIEEITKYKQLTKKIIDFYYTTLQYAYIYEFTDKNNIPFKIKWITVYQEKNESNAMILSFTQQWEFFKYINQNPDSNFKYLLNTINEIYLEKPQKILITPLGSNK